MDVVGNVLAESRDARTPWAGAAVLALVLHAAVLGGLLASALSRPMKFAPPRAVQVRLLPAGSLRAPEVRAAPQPAPPPPPPAVERPRIEKPPEEQPPPPSKKALLLPAPDKKKPPTPVPVSRPGRAPTPAVDLPASGDESAGAASTVAPGAAGAGNAGVGGLKIDQADFKYPIYIERMVMIISLNWFKPAQTVQSSPVVHFQIERDGTVTDARIVTSSGLPFVDRAALRAVLASSPLPPLPADYAGPHLGIQVVFE
jgi:periplasmic protein TonB